MKRAPLKRGPYKRRVGPPEPKACERCGESFTPRVHDHRTYAVRFCSRRCAIEAQREKVIAAYPPKDEVAWLYEVKGLSDVELGKHYGHSYQWSFLLRRHYGIAGRTGSRRKPLKQRGDRARWGIHLKPEGACRSCGRSGLVLHLHHAIPRSVSRAAKYDLRNGVPLCTRCHLGWHAEGGLLYRDIFTAGEWSYLSSVQLTGQRIEAWLEDHYPDRGLPFRTAAGPRCDCGVLLLASGECPTCLEAAA